MIARLVTPCCLALALAAGYFAGLAGFKSSSANIASSASGNAQNEAAISMPASRDDRAQKTDSANTPQSETTVIQTLEQWITLSAFYQGTHNPLAGLTLEEVQAGLRHLDSKKPTGKQEWHHRLLRSALYAAWAQHDLPAALASARQIQNPDTKRLCLTAICGFMAATDPEAAIAKALSLSSDHVSQNSYLTAIFKAWAERDAKAALAYVLKHPDIPQLHNGASAVFDKLALESPQFALAEALKLPPGGMRDNMISPKLMDWMERDQNAALQWTLRLNDPVLRDEMLQYMVASGRVKDQAALNLLDQIESPGKRDEAFKSYYYDLSRKDAAAALDFLLSLNDESLQKNLLITSSWSLQRANDDKQKQFLAKLPGEALKQTLLQTLAPATLEQGRFPQTVYLLNEMEDSLHRDYGLHSLGFAWGKRNTKEAEAWIQAQSRSTDRDIVVAGFAVNLAQNNQPQEALRWIATIADPGVSKTARQNSFFRWFKHDAASAREWMNANRFFSPQEKQKLLRDAPRQGNAFATPQAQNNR